MSESRTIQLWPGGKSVTFRREADSIKIGTHFFRGRLKSRKLIWGAATPEEAEAIEVELLAESLLERDVLACQSGLVDSLLKSDFDGFTLDEVQNLYPKFDGKTAAECREFIDDHGSESDYPNDSNPFGMDSVALTEILKAQDIDSEEMNDREMESKLFAMVDEGDWGDVEDWREAARQLAEPQEIYEWWLVSKHLARNLTEIGEPILDNGFGTWFGRTATGQSLIMDGTLQEVARAMRSRVYA